ncbi:MAG TPA: FmdB family zinc ribbon protein [Anaeromyxobacteraceae bacterium]|nr:FmdB family zinc ribbon protein [Anaeromyxobacteraceae bacterium]
MPIYEYECERCGRFDVLQKISSPVLEKHDACGAPVRKLMSASAFSFKGSGFYVTDYGGKSPAHVRAGEKPPPAEKKAEACATCPANGSC